MSDAPHVFGSPESNDEIPNVVLQDKYVKSPLKAPDTSEIPREERAKSQIDKLPKTKGYKVLVVPYTAPSVSKGGIIYTSETTKREELATTIGYVIDMGDGAYTDPGKTPGDPWCQTGDYIIFGRYAGARIEMQGEDNDNLPLRLINDDEVLAVVNNPEDYVGVK
jgi:co-chaperonin GroES (HSP10)